MSNELIYRGTHEKCIFFVKEDLEMSVGREDGEYAGNYTGPTSQLFLTCLIQTESANGVCKGLDNLCDSLVVCK